MKKFNKLSGRFQTIFDIAPQIFTWVFTVYILISLMLNIFIDKAMTNYFSANLLETPNVQLVCIALLMVILFFEILWVRIRKASGNVLCDRQFVIWLAFCFYIVYHMQSFILEHMWIRSGWDVGVIVDEAENIGLLGADTVSSYFSRYPNNMILVYTEALLLKVAKLFSDDPYLSLLKMNALIVCLSVYMSVLCVFYRTKNKRITVLTAVLGVALIAFSPWISVPYSDTVGMFFVTLTTFCFICIKNTTLKYLAVTIFSFIGYLYKPTAIIVFIAFLLIVFCEYMVKLATKSLSIKEPICLFLSIAMALVINSGISFFVYSIDKTEFDTNAEFTMTHYLMMGHNQKSDGIYWEEDVVFTANTPKEKRQQANIETTILRIKEMGPKGYIQHITRKNINNYNDGTFGWGREGSFYLVINPSTNKTAEFLKSWYYTGGDKYQYFACLQQVLWLCTLILVCCCSLFKKQKAEMFVCISLIGISMFLLIFESRARYLYMFSPLYVFLAGVGLYKMSLIPGKKSITDLLKRARGKAL